MYSGRAAIHRSARWLLVSSMSRCNLKSTGPSPRVPCFFSLFVPADPPFSGLEAAAMGMMDPGFMKEAMEMMNDPAVMKQVTLALLTTFEM